MTRLLAIGCAAALLMAMVAYAQDGAPPPATSGTSTVTGGAAVGGGGGSGGVTISGGTAPAPAGAPGGTISTVNPATGATATMTAGGSGGTSTAAPAGSNFFFSTGVPGGAGWAGPNPFVAIADGKPADPETVKLMQGDRELSGKIGAIVAGYKELTDSAKRAEAEQQIAKLVAEQFSIRQQLREKQLQALEDQLKRLHALHAQRNEQRDQIVGDRVKQLLREAAGLGWGDAAGGFDYALPIRLKAEVDAAMGGPLAVGKDRRVVIRKQGPDGGPAKVETYESSADAARDAAQDAASAAAK